MSLREFLLLIRPPMLVKKEIIIIENSNTSKLNPMYPSCSKSSEWHFSRLESWNRRSRLVSNFHISVVTSRQAFEVVTKMIHSNITILFIWKRSKIQIYIHWHWFYVRASPKSTLASKTLLEGNNNRFFRHGKTVLLRPQQQNLNILFILFQKA